MLKMATLTAFIKSDNLTFYLETTSRLLLDKEKNENFRIW